MSVAENVAHIREAIAAAARRAQRQPEEIALMAVTKTFPPERIREAYDAGLRLFGENRVQEFAGKAGALADLRDADWHMIGHLQTNKAGKAAELFAAVDSVDSLRLAQKINDSAQQLGKETERSDRNQRRRRGGQDRHRSRIGRTAKKFFARHLGSNILYFAG